MLPFLVNLRDDLFASMYSDLCIAYLLLLLLLYLMIFYSFRSPAVEQSLPLTWRKNRKPSHRLFRSLDSPNLYSPLAKQPSLAEFFSISSLCFKRFHASSWVYNWYGCLGSGFKYVLFSSLFGEDVQFDSYFSDGLVQPPTSCLLKKLFFPPPRSASRGDSSFPFVHLFKCPPGGRLWRSEPGQQEDPSERGIYSAENDHVGVSKNRGTKNP